MVKHLHVLGIAGTFMAGIAALAKELGYRVTGSDLHIYPPMSTQLEALGIELIEGYDPAQLQPRPDEIIIGNAMKRGNPCVEAILDLTLPFYSGPQWLYEHVLRDRTVLAVSGTHGKTTTSSILAWLLEAAGLQPGFLIGGIPRNFGVSARLGQSQFFVIEADEYDTAFFDKRSKFIHYRPDTLIINNCEFDHADIFPDLTAILTQFHHLLRLMPARGHIVYPSKDPVVTELLRMGVWSQLDAYDSDAALHIDNRSGVDKLMTFCLGGEVLGEYVWPLLGTHNVSNLRAACTAFLTVADVSALQRALNQLGAFESVARRLELIAEVGGVAIYDDFAHHPTAIMETLAALKAVSKGRILAVLECRSYTMRSGVHQTSLADALCSADVVYIKRPDPDFGIDAVAAQLGVKAQVLQHVEEIVDCVCNTAQPGDKVLVMSNGGFDNIYQKLKAALCAEATIYVHSTDHGD